MAFEVYFLFGSAPTCYFISVNSPRRELYEKYWNEIGAEDVASTIEKFNNLNTGRAKNVILFVGDGMSLATVVAGRMHKAQKQRPAVPGEETFSALDVMPHLGLMKTYSGELLCNSPTSCHVARFRAFATRL